MMIHEIAERNALLRKAERFTWSQAEEDREALLDVIVQLRVGIREMMYLEPVAMQRLADKLLEETKL